MVVQKKWAYGVVGALATPLPFKKTDAQALAFAKVGAHI